jgi:hypothetical protein
MSKGSGRRPKEIQEYLDTLNWALRSDKTDQDTKDDILCLLEMKQEFQCKIADITTSDTDREVYRKVINGDLPVIHVDGGITLYFPWSDHPDVQQYVKNSKDLVARLVSGSIDNAKTNR